MKKNYITIVTVLLTINSFAQAPNWAWAINPGGSTNNSEANSVATDGAGNVYVAGYFSSSTMVIGASTITNAFPGYDNMFLAKFDASGNALWARSAGGSDNDVATSVAIDAAGNIYVTGYFSSTTITFGSFTLSTTSYSAMFLAKYDATGTVLWARGATAGFDFVRGNAVATDGAGNVCVTGYFSTPTITFGTVVLTNTHTGFPDVFLTKYDAAGNVLWAQNAIGTGVDMAMAIATDASDNIYITGEFDSLHVTFGSVILTNVGGENEEVFLSKYDAAGNVLWARSAGGINNFEERGKALATDATGNVYIAGSLSSGSFFIGPYTLLNHGFTDMFVAKYDAAGSVVWAKSAGGLSYDEANGIALDASDNIYVTGFFNSAAISFAGTALTNPHTGFAEVFLTKYDTGGNVLWAKSAGGNNTDVATSVVTQGADNVYVGGYFASVQSIFDADTLHNPSAYLEMFLANINTLVAINEGNDNKTDVSLFPNPTTGQLTVNSEQLTVKDIKVYNVLGEMVNDKWLMINGKNATIDMTGYSKGIYFVRIVSTSSTTDGSPTNVVNRKIIVQ